MNLSWLKTVLAGRRLQTEAAAQNAAAEALDRAVKEVFLR